MKEAGMRIRIEPDLRNSFIAACKSQDLSAAHVLRAFMRNYVSAHLQHSTANNSDQIQPTSKTYTADNSSNTEDN